MPPIPTWMSGREAVLRLLEAKIGRSGPRRLVAVQANGGTGFATYVAGDDGVLRGYALQVPTLRGDRIAGVLSFHAPQLFPAFGVPPVLGPGG